MAAEHLVYCLTRDRDLAARLDERLVGGIAFFYNDAARLHQAVTLRPPQLVLVDTGAIRAEYGDAGLGPVVAYLRERAAGAQILIRAAQGVDRLVAAEAGPGVEIVAAEAEACIAAVTAACAAA